MSRIFSDNGIVFCRDCKYRRDRLYCRRIKNRPVIVCNTDFCSYGSKKSRNALVEQDAKEV